MEVIKIIIAIILGSVLCGFGVKEIINSFKNEEYFWVGAFGTSTLLVIVLLIDFVLYQAFMY